MNHIELIERAKKNSHYDIPSETAGTLEEMAEALEDALRAIEALNEENDTLQYRIDGLNADIASLESEKAELFKEKNGLVGENIELHTENSSLRFDIEELKHSNKPKGKDIVRETDVKICCYETIKSGFYGVIGLDNPESSFIDFAEGVIQTETRLCKMLRGDKSEEAEEVQTLPIP